MTAEKIEYEFWGRNFEIEVPVDEPGVVYISTHGWTNGRIEVDQSKVLARDAETLDYVAETYCIASQIDPLDDDEEDEPVAEETTGLGPR